MGTSRRRSPWPGPGIADWSKMAVPAAVRAAQTATMSHVIKDLQRSFAPAFKVSIPSVPTNAFTAPNAISSVLEPILRAHRRQFAGIFQALDELRQELYPPNCRGVEGLDIAALEVILLDEGIPLAAVPRPTTVQDLVDALDASQRRTILGRRWRSITTDCTRVLEGCTDASLGPDLRFARKIIDALRAGHPEAAQALAANLLDSLLRKHFDHSARVAITANKSAGPRLVLDDYVVRVACTIAPVWAAYAQFYTDKGDPIPRTFARHASAHAVSATQYTRTNAVIGVMLATSVLWLLDREAATSS